MNTIKHVSHEGMMLGLFALGTMAAVYGARLVADGFVYVGSFVLG